MDRAVVVGGSLAGLLCAAVLAEHAGEVVVVERDDLPAGSGSRRGVPQGRHLHGLLSRGLREIEARFPGITEELLAEGAIAGDPGIDLHWYIDGRRKPGAPVGEGVVCSRPFLEWHLRRRLAALSNVEIRHARVEGLTATGTRVDGVILASGPSITGDLVVDCSGNVTRIDSWLVDLGHTAPPQRRVDIDLGYATRIFRREPGELLDGAVALLSMTLDIGRARGGGAFAIEGDRWVVTIAGYAADKPTSDPDEFTERVASEPVPALRRLVTEGTPLSDVATYRYSASVRRDFDRMASLPGGLVAAGDAVARFNPIYGQGMTSAALHAATLHHYLASGADPHQPARRYFAELRKVVDAVWQVAATEDFRLPHVTGDRPLLLGLMHRISGMYARATLRDPELHRQFLLVVNFEQGPEVLLRPDNLLRGWLAAQLGPPDEDAPAGAIRSS